MPTFPMMLQVIQEYGSDLNPNALEFIPQYLRPPVVSDQNGFNIVAWDEPLGRFPPQIVRTYTHEIPLCGTKRNSPG